MQGGRGFAGLFPPADESSQSSGGEEIKVSEQIHLSKTLDAWLHRTRQTLALLLALPVCWLHLAPSVEALKDRKLKAVKRGTDTILTLQTYRFPVLDVFMQAFSFCAEEEFYLLAMPLLFWSWDYLLGFRLTFIVCSGLFVGNILKDVFQLPRPLSPPVWRPHANLDSAGLQDFGYPSTHAMNAITNSCIVAWHYSAFSQTALLGCLAYIFFLSISRLYLGAHTGTDVRGGWALGVLVLAVYTKCDHDILLALGAMSPAQVFVWGFVLAIFLLLLVPQPRPPTPTFLQNALLIGLLWGLCVGVRAAPESVKQPGSELGPAKLFPRLVFSFTLVLITRVVVKALVTFMVHAVGINTKPVVKVLEKRSKRRGRIHLLTRDKDLIGMAIVKTLVYFSLAFQICYGAPMLSHALGWI